jgi:hypothetical protein
MTDELHSAIASRTAGTTSDRRRLVALVFSRDRAMQLEALLRSLATMCVDPAVLERVHVLCTGSTDRYLDQYRLLATGLRAPFPVDFHTETAFRRDVLSILGLRDARGPLMALTPGRVRLRLERRGVRSTAGAEWSHVLFLVDDNLFVRPFSLAHVLRALRARPSAAGFSLRLGRNTTYCHPRRMLQAIPRFERLDPEVLAFRWPGADCDFGYPLEVSSSVYSSAIVAGLLTTLDYSNPNTLEDALARGAKRFELASWRPELCCFESSVAFCNAVNRVQSTAPNRAGETVGLPAQELAELFDQGKRIDTVRLEGFVPNGCHTEVPFEFIDSSASPERHPPAS